MIIKLEEITKEENLFLFYKKATTKIFEFRKEKIEKSHLREYLMRTIFLIFLCIILFFQYFSTEIEFISLGLILFSVVLLPFIFAKIFEIFHKRYILIEVACIKIQETSMRSSTYNQIYFFKNYEFNLEYEIVARKNRWSISEQGILIMGLYSHDIIDITKKERK
ncbi:MAG: hypothetical protein ACRCTZ_14650 [Sarcina sp.]